MIIKLYTIKQNKNRGMNIHAVLISFISLFVRKLVRDEFRGGEKNKNIPDSGRGVRRTT